MADNKRHYEDFEVPAPSKGTGATINKKGGTKTKKSFAQKWRALKKWQKGLIIAVLVLVLLLAAAFIAVFGIYSGFKTNIDKDELGVSDDILKKYGNTDIFNVAIFGVDTRNEDSFKGLSDTIMIVSLDAKNGSVKIVSILRDSYVAIDGHGKQKITHAYSYGGAPLAIKTINKNFNMNITDYATINMFKLSDAINTLGGIDIEITESERDQINQEALYGDEKAQRGAALVNDYGQVHLDGDQAVIFCRLRHQDNDEARSNRQKMVINALLKQARKVSPTKYAEVVRTMMSLCETSVSFSEIMKFVPLINADISIEAITVPGEPENAIGGIYEGYWVWRYDLESAAERIHMFIYGEPANSETGYNSSKDADITTTKKAAGDTGSTTKKNNSNVITIVGETTTKGKKAESNQSPTTEPQTQETTTAAPPPETTVAPETTAQAQEPPTSAPEPETKADSDAA